MPPFASLAFFEDIGDSAVDLRVEKVLGGSHP